MAIEIVRLEQTCTACPSQWEGATAHGQAVYVRYRWGYLSVRIDGNEVYGAQVGDGYDGTMTTEELADILEENGVWLATI
jgi:hypothetical protein